MEDTATGCATDYGPPTSVIIGDHGPLDWIRIFSAVLLHESFKDVVIALVSDVIEIAA